MESVRSPHESGAGTLGNHSPSLVVISMDKFDPCTKTGTNLIEYEVYGTADVDVYEV